MTNYVLGFAFSEDFKRIALIRKNKPEWQKGKLNGVGGKVEVGETPVMAMAREFQEETGYSKLIFWKHFGLIFSDKDQYNVDCFSAKLNNLSELGSPTDETIEIHSTFDLLLGYQNCLRNLPWLIGVAIQNQKFEEPNFICAKYV